MRLTQHTDYSLRVLIYLACDPERLVTIQQISEAYGISRNHLMKVVRELANQGYVASTRGAGGGIRLGRPPESIRIGDVVRAMEPDFALVECFRPDNACVITPACRLPHLLEEAAAAFLATLDGYTLADLLPPRQVRELRGLLRLTG